MLDSVELLANVAAQISEHQNIWETKCEEIRLQFSHVVYKAQKRPIKTTHAILKTQVQRKKHDWVVLKVFEDF